MVKPVFSVVVASYNQQETIGRCIQALIKQETNVPYEIIVVDSSNNSARKISESFGSKIRLIKRKKQTGWGKARNIGIRAARGKFIAFTDTDCVADSRWIDELCKAHQKSSAVGGRILNGNPESAVGWAIYLAEFVEFAAREDKPAYHLPGCNSSFSRAIFDSCGAFPEEHYFGAWDDLVFSGRIKIGKLFASNARVFHINRSDLKSALRHCFELGSSGARMTKSHHFRGMIAMRFPFLAPILVFPRLGSIGLNSWKAGCFSSFLFTFPLIALMVCAWNLGICVGTLKK